MKITLAQRHLFNGSQPMCQIRDSEDWVQWDECDLSNCPPYRLKGSMHAHGKFPTYKYEELPTEKEKIVKKVYRKIVTKTHPDKLEKLPDSRLKDKLVQQFKEAVEHYNNNDVVGLFDAADELEIDLPEIDESHINMMETNVHTLKEKVQRLRESNAWKWYHSEEKEFIMNQIINSL